MRLRFVIPLAVSMVSAAQAADVQELGRITVTATRTPREIAGVAGTVTVIDEEQIRRQLARDIKDLIRYEPGLSVANSAARFGLAGFNIRGMDGNRVQMRIDNVRMADAFAIGSFSDARRSLIDLDAVKSVEIVRGAASALYGSDAIGGVVSFILKEPRDYLAEGRSSAIAFNSGYQSDDKGWYSGGRWAFGGGQFGGLVLYTHRAGHETDNQGDIGSADRTRTRPNPQSHDSDSVLAKLSWNANDANTLRLTVEADDGSAATNVLSGVGVSGTANTQSLRGDDQQRRRRVSFQHELVGDNAMFDALDWTVYMQQSDTDQRTAEQRFATAAGPASTVRRERTFTFEQSLFGGEVVLEKGSDAGVTAHTLTYGLDFVRTDTDQMRRGVQTTLATGAQTSNIPPDNFPVRDFPQTKTLQYGAFVQDEIDVGRSGWRVVPGVRVDRYELHPRPDSIYVADNPGVAVAGIDATSVTPKLGLLRSFSAHYSAFAQYARGFRAPPYNDVNIGFTNLAIGYTAIANPQLRPETSNGYEIGVRGNLTRGSFALSAFYNDYDNFIESLVNTGVQNGLIVFQSRNVAQARIYGAEFRGALDLATLVPSLDGWTLRSSVAWASGENRVINEPLNSVDPLKGVLGIGYAPSEHWSAELVGTAVDRKSHVDETAGAMFEPAGYVTLDLLVHAQLGERWRIDAGLFNLADRKYWEWSDVRGRAAGDPAIDRYTRPGLNASASASVRF